MELVFVKEVNIKDTIDNDIKLVRYKVGKYEVDITYKNKNLHNVVFHSNYNEKYCPCIEPDYDYFRERIEDKDKTKMFDISIMDWRFMKIKDMEKAIKNCQEAIEVVKVVSEFINNNRNTD